MAAKTFSESCTLIPAAAVPARFNAPQHRLKTGGGVRVIVPMRCDCARHSRRAPSTQISTHCSDGGKIGSACSSPRIRQVRRRRRSGWDEATGVSDHLSERDAFSEPFWLLRLQCSKRASDRHNRPLMERDTHRSDTDQTPPIVDATTSSAISQTGYICAPLGPFSLRDLEAAS